MHVYQSSVLIAREGMGSFGVSRGITIWHVNSFKELKMTTVKNYWKNLWLRAVEGHVHGAKNSLYVMVAATTWLAFAGITFAIYVVNSLPLVAAEGPAPRPLAAPLQDLHMSMLQMRIPKSIVMPRGTEICTPMGMWYMYCTVSIYHSEIDGPWILE